MPSLPLFWRPEPAVLLIGEIFAQRIFPPEFGVNLQRCLKSQFPRLAFECGGGHKSSDDDVVVLTPAVWSYGADAGSLMVQMGMARAADPYYQGEEGYAQAEHRGVWRRGQGAPL